MWNPGFFLEEGRGLSTVPVPASCTLTVKDLLLSGSSDAVSVPTVFPIPACAQSCPFLDAILVPQAWSHPHPCSFPHPFLSLSLSLSLDLCPFPPSLSLPLLGP